MCFDKPLTWTSFALVNKIRYHLCRKMGVKKLKVGHAGTLDPLATGVMIICTGKATKRIEEFQYHTKEYIATLMLGATTPSYDLEKEIDATYPTEHITRELVEETLKKFIGSIELNELIQQNNMSGGGDRQPFGDALHNAEENGL